MKRRFEQNQQDCVFTVLSLLPTLGDQLLHELNVESITAKLQQSRSQRSTPAPTPDSSMLLPPKATEGEATTAEATNVNGEETEEKKEEQEHEGENLTSDGAGESPKVNGDSESHQANGDAPHADAAASETETEKVVEKEGPTVDGSAPEIQVQQQQEEATTAEESAAHAQAQAQAMVKDEITAAAERRAKLELWSELKNMSLTRTVTALYSLTFLTLLTQVQLNLLGRFTYVSSVVALSNTTDASYRVESPATKGSLTSTNGLLDYQTEKKYLTFSYWLLHEGWRRWNEKVRDAVEDIVGG